jgi:hypothetical protein
MDMEAKLEELNYIQKINEALNNHQDAIRTFTQILKDINEIYKYIEPEFHKGRIILFKTITPQSRPLKYNDENYFFDLFSLAHESSIDIIIQLNDSEPNLLWKNERLDLIHLSKEAIVYEYSNKEEKFYAGGKVIKMVKRVNSASNYATYFSDLRQALTDYKRSHIRHSSCPIFNKVWLDENRIFFKNAPESDMQCSLNEFLKSRLYFKGEIEIAREHNTDTSNPIDIRVLWKKASRSALIEIKWLGKSISKEGKITSYYNHRAVEGLNQLKKYLDKDRKSNPTDINKGFLIVIDGRRYSPNKNTRLINRQNGFYYENIELKFETSEEYHKVRREFEKPIRMFVEPICQD